LSGWYFREERAEHDQMIGQLIEFECLDVGERVPNRSA